MFFSKIHILIRDVFAGLLSAFGNINGDQGRPFIGFIFAGMSILLVSLCSITQAETYTANISVSSSTVIKDFLANTTNQYLSTIQPSTFFKNTWTINITGKNLGYQAPSVSTTLINLDSIANKLIAISTDSFVNTYALGMMYERQTDVTSIEGMKKWCGYTFLIPEATVNIDSMTCVAVMDHMKNFIESQSSGAYVVPQ